MTAEALPQTSNRELALRVGRTYLLPRWKGLTVSIIAAIVVAFFSAKLIQILEPAINDLLVNHKPGTLVTIPLMIAGMALGRGIAQVVQSYVVNRIGNGIVGQVQVQLFGKLVRADLARLRTEHSGSYVSSVLYDAGLIREAATSGVVNYTQHILIVIGAITVMVSNDMALSIAVIVVAPLIAWTMRRFARRTTKAARGAMAET
ncbi:MAG TPA: ABC transporter transmembrane domain-containing protein, partial [Caulobacteraceae bacterium]|nr:ABC transporter transmembrane domain-containing protein [Caulobacteraceae bacterium]